MTNEEIERAIGFLLESQAKHDAQIAELHNIIREQSASQSELNQAMTQAITDLAGAQRRTETKVDRLVETQQRTETNVERLIETQQRSETNVERLADKVERLADKVDRLADIAERGNGRQNETDARLDRLSEVVERLVTRGE
jgi:uncharacterized protein YfbU (UPF0304 family)